MALSAAQAIAAAIPCFVEGSVISDPGTIRARLVDLASSISRELSNVCANAAAAHQCIDALACTDLSSAGDDEDHSEASARIITAALHADVSAVEARKTSALETEAVCVDAVLELADSMDSDAAARDTLLEFVSTHASVPVETADIRVVSAHASPMCAHSARVVAPTTLGASDVCVRRCNRVHAGPSQVLFEIAIAPGAVAALDLWKYPADAAVAMGSLARHIRVVAALSSCEADAAAARVRGVPLPVAVALSSSGKALAVSADLSAAKQSGCAFVIVATLSAFGQALLVQEAAGDTATTSLLLPIAIPVMVKCAMLPPICFPLSEDDEFPSYTYMTPAITPDGVLFVPGARGKVLVHGPDGAQCPALDPPGLLRPSAVAYCPKTRLLFVADGRCRLLAVDEASGAICWSAADAHEGAADMSGLAVLPEEGVVVMASSHSRLLVFRVSDGTPLAVVDDEAFPVYLAADAASGTLFVSHGCAVGAYTWDAAGATLRPVGDESSAALRDAAGEGDNFRPLAVVPAMSGFPACLVAAVYSYPDLRIISLPDFKLIGEYALPDLDSLEDAATPDIAGLAADPSGTALAVYDNAGYVMRIVAWPPADIARALAASSSSKLA